MGIFFREKIILVGTFMLTVGLVIGVSFSAVSAQSSNTLSIKYLDDFPGGVDFDSRYKEVDKYLVYKYVSFSFAQDVVINSVGLSFLVDDEWYIENEVKDIVFLKFENGSWDRIGYDSKTASGSNRKYQVTSNSIGQYWAIIGVIPEGEIASGTIGGGSTEHKKIFNPVEADSSVNDIMDIGESIVVTLKEPIKVKGASVIATTTATISAVTLLAILNGPASLWIVLQQIGVAFLGLFFLKKRHRSGMVYDANTGMSIPLVRVDLIDKESDRIKATRFTDKNGRYYFLAPKGDYYLELRKKGYKIVENNKAYLLKALLHESDIELEVGLNEAGIIKKNIAILQDDHTAQGQIKAFFTVAMKYLLKVAFFVGVIISLWSCYINPTFFNFFIFGIYVLIIVFKGFFAKSQKYGTIVNSNNKPEPFASINVLDAKTKKTVSRVISDTNGRYYILLEKGEYILNIRTVEGMSVKRKIKVKGKNILSHKLVIKK